MSGEDSRPPPLPPSWARNRMTQQKRPALQRVTDSLVSYVQAIYAFICLFLASLLEPFIPGKQRHNNDDKRNGPGGGPRRGGGFGRPNYPGGPAVQLPEAKRIFVNTWMTRVRALIHHPLLPAGPYSSYPQILNNDGDTPKPSLGRVSSDN